MKLFKKLGHKAMKYEQLEDTGEEQFRRLSGVKCSIFEKMKEILESANQKEKSERRTSFKTERGRSVVDSS